ncbi:hypothetical protein DMC14_003090 [Metamycoplasma phocicerebrale]|uniref:Uncharacterized protein n=1 Tax=Metamycoplasma phocicerebrale TaxID=142649 RepID=A0A3Q9VAH0_9BACT|nr:hypothetical protein [Metamycoplasma phocicerebrale]AZZ65748.1 hypothetical protein DMC14_003090 [Metamycoplasma phocicerebrale]
MNSSKKRSIVLISLGIMGITVAGATTAVLLAKKENKTLSPKQKLENDIKNLNELIKEAKQKANEALKTNDKQKLSEAKTKLEEVNKLAKEITEKAKVLNEKEIENKLKEDSKSIDEKEVEIDDKLKTIVKQQILDVKNNINTLIQQANDALSETPLDIIKLAKIEKGLSQEILKAKDIQKEATNLKLDSEANELTAPISNGEIKLAELRTKIQELEKIEEERIKLQKSKLKEAIEELNEAIKGANGKINKVDSLTLKLSDLEYKIASNELIHNEAKNEVKNDGIVEIQNLITELKEKLELAKTTNTSLKANLDASKQEVENAVLVAKNETIVPLSKADTALAGNDKTKLREARTLLENSKAKLESSSQLALDKDYANQKTTADNQLKIVNDKIKAIDDKLNAEFNTLKGELTDLNSTLITSINKAKEDIDYVQKPVDLTKLQQDINDSEAKLNSIDSITKTKVQAEFDTLKNTVELAKTTLQEETQKMENKKQEIDSSIQDIQSKIDKATDDLNIAGSDQAKIEKVLEDSKTIQTFINSLKAEGTKYKYKETEINQLQSNLDVILNNSNTKLKASILDQLNNYELVLNVQDSLPSNIAKQNNNFKIVDKNDPTQILDNSLFNFEIINTFANDKTPKLYVEYKVSSIKYPDLDLGNKKVIIEKSGNNLVAYQPWTFDSISLKELNGQTLQNVYDDLNNNKDDAYNTLNKYFTLNNQNKALDSDEVVKLSNLVIDTANNTISFKVSVLKPNLANATDYVQTTENLETQKAETITADYSAKIKELKQAELDNPNNFKDTTMDVDASTKNSLASEVGENLDSIDITTSLGTEYNIEFVHYSPNDQTGELTLKYKIIHPSLNIKSNIIRETKISGFKKLSHPTHLGFKENLSVNDLYHFFYAESDFATRQRHFNWAPYNIYGKDKVWAISRRIEALAVETTNKADNLIYKYLQALTATNEVVEWDNYMLENAFEINNSIQTSETNFEIKIPNFKTKIIISRQEDGTLIYDEKTSTIQTNEAITYQQIYDVYKVLNSVGIMRIVLHAIKDFGVYDQFGVIQTEAPYKIFYKKEMTYEQFKNKVIGEMKTQFVSLYSAKDPSTKNHGGNRARLFLVGDSQNAVHRERLFMDIVLQSNNGNLSF